MSNYHSFGMPMPGRSLSLSNYRFGFNGKEKDDEVKGKGNQVDYGMRTYDPRLGKFLSIDPLSKKYPWYTPYQFAGNNPIQNVDLDGAEEENYLIHALKVFLGLGPKPKSAEEAHFDANERDAINKTNEYVKKLGETYDNVYGNIIPGYSAGLNTSQKQYGTAGLLIVADLFGGKLSGTVVKGIGLKVPATLVSLSKGLTGEGMHLLEKTVAKVEAQASKLSDETVTGAAKEILGISIENPKLNANPEGHLIKVNEALKGISNSINTLREGIASGSITDQVAKEANRIANGLQMEKDRITNQLERAVKKAKNK